MLKKISLKLLIIPLAFLLSGCASLSNISYFRNKDFTPYPKEVYLPQNIEWEKVNDWADHFVFYGKDIPLIYHVVKIDLSSKTLKISGFPSQSIKRKNSITAKRLSKNFSKGVLINTTPYTTGFSPKRIVGIHKIEGKNFSKEVLSYSALALKKESDGTYLGEIIEKQTEESFTNFESAFGGFFTILKDSQKIKFYETRDSRTGVGLTKDKKTLFILAVEGEKLQYSEGLSYPECADIFLTLGATDAMEFDGGGSTSLYINGKNALSYGSIRHNPAYLYFFEEPL